MPSVPELSNQATYNYVLAWALKQAGGRIEIPEHMLVAASRLVNPVVQQRYDAAARAWSFELAPQGGDVKFQFDPKVLGMTREQVRLQVALAQTAQELSE